MSVKLIETLPQFNDETNNILIQAVQKNASWAVKLLLTELNDEIRQKLAKERDHREMTALMYAVYNGDVESVRVLSAFQQGMQDGYGQTAVVKLLRSRGTRRQKSQIFEILKNFQNELSGLEDSWLVSLKEQFGEFVIQNVIVKDENNMETNLKQEKQKLLIPPCSCKNSSQNAPDGARFGCMACLLKYLSTTTFEETVCEALLQAAKNGHTGCVRLILNSHIEYLKKIALELQNNTQTPEETPLSAAAALNHAQCVRLLLDLYGKQRVGKKKQTALMRASETGALSCVQILLKSEAGIRDNDGETALGLALFGEAKFQQKAETVQILIQNIKEVDATVGGFSVLKELLVSGNVQKKVIIEQIMKEMPKDAIGRGFLHYAAALGRVDLIEQILNSPVNCDEMFFQTDSKGDTALMAASRQNSHVVAKLLAAKQAGYQNYVEGQPGHTALMKAAFHGSLEVAEILTRTTENGRKNERGLTALEVAFQANQFEVVEFLFKNSAVELLRLRDQRLARIAEQLQEQININEVIQATQQGLSQSQCTCGGFQGQASQPDFQRAILRDCAFCALNLKNLTDDTLEYVILNNSWHVLAVFWEAEYTRKNTQKTYSVNQLPKALGSLSGKQVVQNEQIGGKMLKLLTLAASHGSVGCLCYLVGIIRRENLQIPLELGELTAPLHAACKSNNVISLQLLLPLFKRTTVQGESASSAAFRQSNFHCLKFLLEDSAEVQRFRPQKHLKTAARKACCLNCTGLLAQKFIEPVEEETRETLNEISGQPCKCGAKCSEACPRRDFSLKARYDPFQAVRSNCGVCCLRLAKYARSETSSGKTLLEAAVEEDRPECVLALLSEDFQRRNQPERPGHASKKQRPQGKPTAVHKNNHSNLLNKCVTETAGWAARFLLASSVETQNFTPLMKASLRKDWRVIMKTLKTDSKLPKEAQQTGRKDAAGFTALMYTAYGNEQLLNKAGRKTLEQLFLVEGGAQNSKGQTAMMLAAKRGQVELLEVFLQVEERYGVVESFLSDYSGFSLQDYAVESGDSNTIRILKPQHAKE